MILDISINKISNIKFGYTTRYYNTKTKSIETPCYNYFFTNKNLNNDIIKVDISNPIILNKLDCLFDLIIESEFSDEPISNNIGVMTTELLTIDFL